MCTGEHVVTGKLTQMVRPGLPGVHEPGLEQELSEEEVVG